MVNPPTSAHRRSSTLIALALLALMFVLMFASAWDDTLTFDEIAHIPAGYSYLTRADMRLNPEHPPLLKDWAALPLLTSGLTFPADNPGWKDDVNGQWTFGYGFIYFAGNNPDLIRHLARIPMMVLTVGLGALLFWWTRRRYGEVAAFTALMLFAFSPNFIAQGRYVTTDVGASFGFLIAIIAFIRFLEEPTSKRRLVLAGFAYGFAQLLKFSAFLLGPLFVALTVLYIILESDAGFWSMVRRYVGALLAIFAVGYALVWAVYVFHTAGYPAARQARDMAAELNNYAGGPSSPAFAACNAALVGLKRFARCPAEVGIWMADKPVLRALAHYLKGVLMVFQRSAGGNTTYFWGQVSAAGWRSYFPAIYALKETLPALILAFFAMAYAVARSIRSMTRAAHWFSRSLAWLREHPAETAMLAFVGLYWLTSIRSNLNIGFRHILPTLPFIYILTARQIAVWFKPVMKPSGRMPWRMLVNFAKGYGAMLRKSALLGVFILWQAVNTFAVFPSYLAHGRR
ncbi:glycosyltransferase family 39 protein [Candidatus Parcubacteria bacterium]|nr:glycosyltransferase family 39 protein [Candidatus Parcubacteria bacterium]